MNIKINKKFQPLFKDYQDVRIILLAGGRGSGKSFAGSLWLTNKFYNSKKNALYLRKYATNIQKSIIPQFLQQVQCLQLQFSVKRTVIENNYGSKLFFMGMEASSLQADSKLKSIPNLQNVLIEEATEVTEEQFQKLNLTLRDKDCSPKIVLTFNPNHENHWIYQKFYKNRNIPYDFNGKVQNIQYIFTTFNDNLQNLDKSFINQAESCKKYQPLKYKRDFLGQWLLNSNNALWTKQLLQLAKDFKCSNNSGKMYLGLDVAVSTNQNSDQTAFTLVQKYNNQFYVKECIHGKFTPQQWVNKIKIIRDKFPTLKIIAEKNQGGNLIQNALNNAGIRTNIELIQSTQSKIKRAQDIIYLYQKNTVHHQKVFQQLQYQMLTYSGDKNQKSPNCLDSLVFALRTASKASNSSMMYVS